MPSPYLPTEVVEATEVISQFQNSLRKDLKSDLPMSQIKYKKSQLNAVKRVFEGENVRLKNYTVVKGVKL